MGIMNIKKIIIFLLAIGVVAAAAGCARWPEGPEPEPGETEYQLEITVEVSGIIDSSNGIYYIVMDADGNPATGPGDYVSFWDDRFYYIKLEDGFFDFAQVQDDFESIFDGGSFSGNKIQVTIALSDLGDPNSIDINVVTTDSDNNTYDYLDNGYFTINTNLGSKPPITDQENDSGDGGEDFDITKVTAVITTLY
ncbi:hypothetical protein A2V94_06030 [Candidatus Atribacteria bacterium RBG_16_35_8]|nr:MAG: hypothetical protein A2V94_06030 [Candidatus Atribacteria bacterium RBG_16_35_8]